MLRQEPVSHFHLEIRNFAFFKVVHLKQLVLITGRVKTVISIEVTTAG